MRMKRASPKPAAKASRCAPRATPSESLVDPEEIEMKTKPLVRSLLAAAVLAGSLVSAHAHPPSAASELSALSMLPIAVSVAAPITLLSAGAAITVVAVEASAAGTVWVLERASDGARASVRLSGRALEGASAALGTALTVTAISTGWVLSAAGTALAFVPNEIGAALLYNERVTR
jgi:hypothetical protein